MSVIENQFTTETVMSWDDQDWSEVAQDAYLQLEDAGMLGPEVALVDVKADMQSLIYDYHLLHKSSKLGLVNAGMSVPKYIAWDELVREYYLGTGKQPVKIETFGDGLTEAVWNGLPRTGHKMTVLGEQAAAMAND